MKDSKYKPFTIYFISFVIIISGLSGCYSSEMKVSEFKFRYNEQNFVLRSAYCPGDPESCNQIMGDDFIAIDMNQDRIIDKIIRGDISLSEAQEIYDYSLDLLTRQGKIKEIKQESKKYFTKEGNLAFEILSFYPSADKPFNEFKVSDNPMGILTDFTSIFLDKNADGKLNELLKGKMTIEKAQSYYNIVVKRGLNENKLLKINDNIIVK